MVARDKVASSPRTYIDIAFDQEVTVTESYYPELSFTTLFAEVGGSMGLWLGLGLLQFATLVVNASTVFGSILCHDHFKSKDDK